MSNENTDPPEKNKWLKENWDKVLFGFIGLLASGAAGFFGGTYSVRSELSQLSIDVNQNTTDISYIKPRSDRVPDLAAELSALEGAIDDLKVQNVISLQTRELIAQKDDLIRQYTLEALKEIVEDLEGN